MATTMTTHAQHPAPPAPATAGAAVPMTAGQFERLQKIIYERSGIRFQDAKKYILESRLARRLEELEMDSFDDYISFLTIGPYRDDEFQEMFNRVTINETSFFRNEPQLEVFEKQVLPRLLEARPARRSGAGSGAAHSRSRSESRTPRRAAHAAAESLRICESAAAICPGVRLALTSPASVTARGMPQMHAMSWSCAIRVPPLRTSSFAPKNPSSPIPVTTTPRHRTPSVRPPENSSSSTLGL